MGTRARRWAAGGRRERIPISLGPVRATISAPQPLALQLRSSLRDLLRPADGSEAVIVNVGRRPGGHRVSAGRYRAARNRGDTAVDQVVKLLLRISLEQEAGQLHLHAGYVAWHERGVLLAGTDGSGKSTLVAKLVLAGFDYFTEELVGFDRALELSSFAKPLSLTAGSFAELAEIDPARTGIGSASAKVWHVPATALRSGCLGTQARPVALAFVRYVAGSPVKVEDVHPADAARRLLADSPDPPATRAEGMRRAAELCAGLRRVELTFGESDDAIRVVRELAEDGSKAPVSVTSFHATPTIGQRHAAIRSPRRERDVDRDSVLAVAPEVAVVAVGDRALAWHPALPEVIELDTATSAWLLLFDGKTPFGDLVDEVAAANGISVQALVGPACRIAAGLVEIGVVASAR